jgi:hypothetical protein
MADSLLLKELRIVLDAEAALAFESMVDLMKKEMPAIKVQPSQFVSFLVKDFFEAHFEKDKPVLIAEFFDSDSYHEAERKLAKGKPNYEELMQAALDQARKIKSRKRREYPRRKAVRPKTGEALKT